MRSFFAFVIVDVSARQNEFQDKRATTPTSQLEHLKTKEKRTKENKEVQWKLQRDPDLQLSLKQRPREKSAQIGRALSPENLSPPPLSRDLSLPPLSRDESLPRSLSAHALSLSLSLERSPPLSRDLSRPLPPPALSRDLSLLRARS
jgi:hypothetical protein